MSALSALGVSADRVQVTGDTRYDQVWERTHRLGGYLFVLAGIILVLSALLNPSFLTPVIIVVVVMAAGVPLVYSYFAWRQETSRAPNS